MKFISTLFATLAILSTASAFPTMKKPATVESIDNCSQQGAVALTFDDGPHHETQVASDFDDAHKLQGADYGPPRRGGAGGGGGQGGSGARRGARGGAGGRGGSSSRGGVGWQGREIIVGACICDKADSTRALYDAGHTLGSHTWSQADLTQLDEAGIQGRDLVLLVYSPSARFVKPFKVKDAFLKILGVKPLYFQPP
ncbi:hypothetical protein I308_104329 [Cryptococcus tetragattii IND107]|uniref:NodB homology domain-containing protein n=1 Tax=Cryptococcus tetragattii IND107 TaxID=1296105 RepID=A0ABR3BRJ9_9TREE